jgi:hypothetical protein
MQEAGFTEERIARAIRQVEAGVPVVASASCTGTGPVHAPPGVT